LDEQDLIDAALTVRKYAYCKYSNYYVGAALLDDNGTMHVGCNVENAAYPEGTCAEANAIASMIAGGGKTIRSIVIVGGHDEIAEFADDNTTVVLIRPGGHTRSFKIDQLLPRSFHL
jgi:cytidine deaminase